MDFFAVSKLAWTFIEPTNAALLILCLAFFLGIIGYRRGCLGLLGLICGAGLLLMFTPVDRWIAAPLENRFPLPIPPACLDGILVLGGGQEPGISASRQIPIQSRNAGRLFMAIRLKRHYPNARLVFAGGSGDPFNQSDTEASVARTLFQAAGLDADAVLYDDRSRNTWENEVNAKALAHPKAHETWALVTSGLHMPRAVGIARQIGWPVLPWPGDYATPTPATAGWPFGKRLSLSLTLVEDAVREWVGLTVYYLTGRSAALFPAPEPPDTDDASPACTAGQS